MNAKKLLAMILALVMVFALVACGEKELNDTGANQPADTGASQPADTGADEPADESVNKDPIKIGHICDLTGTDALTGKEAQVAMDFAVKYIGDIAGRPIEVIHQDSQSSAAAAADAARKLVEQDEVIAIFGPTLIGHKGTVSNYVASAGVPAIYYNPTPEKMVANNDWVLAASGSTPQMPTVMADYVYSELGYDKIYTLTKDDTGGYSYMDPFIANYTALGGTVLEEKYVPVPTPDFAPYLQTLTDPEADALIAWTSGSEAITFWQTWYELGLHEDLPVVALFHGAFTDTFICDALTGINPPLVEEILGTYAPMTWAYNIDTPENQEFVEAYKAEFGYNPIGNNLSGAAVQVLLLLKTAVEELNGDTSDLEALRDALLAADITGPEGRTVFTDSNVATKDVYVVKVCQLDDGSYNYELVKQYADVTPAGLTVE